MHKFFGLLFVVSILIPKLVSAAEVDYVYDDFGRLKQIIYSDNTVLYEYDNVGSRYSRTVGTLPHAVDDTGNTNKSVAITIDVLENDVGKSGTTLTVSSVTQGANGIVTANSPNITYTPNANFSGQDSFNYTLNDDLGGSTVGSVLINVINNPPIVQNPIPDQKIDANETFIYQLATDVFLDSDVGESLTIDVELSDGGDLPSWLNFDNQTQTFSGTPTFSEVGRLDLKVSATDVNNVSVNNEFSIVVIPSTNRVQADLLAEYKFIGGSGSTIYDLSGSGSPVDLTIQDTSKASWQECRGLTIEQPTLISSNNVPHKIIDEIKTTNEISIEAWVRPADVEQSSLARILTLSNSQNKRNFMLGQSNDYEMRLRTTDTDEYVSDSHWLFGGGDPYIVGGDPQSNLTHILSTRNANGTANLYIDGVIVATRSVGGTMQNWSDDYLFALANDFDTGSPWIGEYYHVSIYSRALTSTQVAQNYQEGIGLPCVNKPPVSKITVPDLVAVQSNLTWGAEQSFDLDGTIVSYDWDFGDGITGSGESINHTYQTIGEYTVTLTVTDDQGGQSTTQRQVSAVVDSNFQVNTLATSNQDNPSITSLADGGFIVVWESYNQDAGVNDNGIFGQRYDANGFALGTEFQANTYTDGNQDVPAITGLVGGGSVVVWESFGQDGSKNGIYGQRFDTSGSPLGSEFQVNTHTNKNQDTPAITALADGGFVVVWESSNQVIDDDIFGQRYDANGLALGTEFQVNTTTGEDQYAPAITGLVDGGFVIVWSSYDQDSGLYDNGVFGQRYDASGLALGDEFQVNTYTSHNQDTPAIAALADGGFVVVWESYGQDGSGNGIYGQRFNIAGSPIGDEFLVNTYVINTQGVPSVSGLANGGFIVSWQSGGQDGSGYGIYAQRYDYLAQPVNDEFKINSFTVNDQKYPSTVSLSSGEVVVVWQSDNQDTSEFGVFGEKIEISDGGLPVPFAVGDISSTDINTPLNLSVESLLANDIGSSYGSLNFISVGNASHGSVFLNGDHIIYTPETNNSQTAFFEYAISDVAGGVVVGTVAIHITGVNTTLTQVVSGVDDAEENISDGSVSITDYALDMVVDDGSTPQIVGLRFPLDIPADATVISAQLEFTAYYTDTQSTDLNIRTELTSNASPFSINSFDISSRVVSDAEVLWSPSSWFYQSSYYGPSETHLNHTPNLSSLVNEVIHQPGWTSGSHIAFIISGNGQRVADSYESDATKAPRLRVKWFQD